LIPYIGISHHYKTLCGRKIWPVIYNDECYLIDGYVAGREDFFYIVGQVLEYSQLLDDKPSMEACYDIHEHNVRSELYPSHGCVQEIWKLSDKKKLD